MLWTKVEGEKDRDRREGINENVCFMRSFKGREGREDLGEPFI